MVQVQVGGIVMLGEEEYEAYVKAGEIASRVVEEGVKKLRPGVGLLEVAESLEKMIRELGGQPAFPCNLSLNQVAAHYAPPAYDTTVLERGMLVKLDVGVHVDGYIADTARTVVVGEQGSRLVEAVEASLRRAIEMVCDGVKTSDIGRSINEEIDRYGFKPIRNLSGHELKRWNLHAGLTIPNYETGGEAVLREDQVVAIEPFVTDGDGKVVDTNTAYIFRFLEDRPVRSRDARVMMRMIKQRYGPLPFAERWVTIGSRVRTEMSIRQLVGVGALKPYPVLREAGNGLVSQAEHTVIVTRDGCEVITRSE